MSVFETSQMRVEIYDQVWLKFIDSELQTKSNTDW